MNCLCAIWVDRNQRAFLAQMIWRHLSAPAKQFLIFDDVAGWQPRLNAEKIGFAQSKFSSCPNTAARKKERKPIVQTNSKVTLHIITSLWVVSVDLSTLSTSLTFSKLSYGKNDRKIPKISPSNLYLKFALEYTEKQSKNGKFPSHYKPAQSILKRKFIPLHKPLRI